MIGRIVGWSLRSRGVVVVLAAARVQFPLEYHGPVLLTAVAIALALVPLTVRGAIPGHEIVQPMALVVLGSLVTATLLNLFVIPPST